MKLLLAACVFAGIVGFMGCASDGPTSQDLGDRFGRGIRGEGTLTPDIDRSDDRYVKPREGAPLPSE